jgi:hypothetical protein
MERLHGEGNTWERVLSTKNSEAGEWRGAGLLTTTLLNLCALAELGGDRLYCTTIFFKL